MMKKANALAEPAAVSEDVLTAMPTPSTTPATKKGKMTGKKKATMPVDLQAMPMWLKTTDGASQCIMAIAHGQKWAFGNAATNNGDVANEPSAGCQWYQKGLSSKRIAPGNPDFADMSWERMRLKTTWVEGNEVGERRPTKNNNQPLMEAV
jgi:hypothetical protein